MKAQKILFLTLNTFSLTGGIEKVGRCVAKVLSDLQGHGDLSFKLFSLHDGNSDVNEKYLLNRYFKGFRGGAIKFGILSLLQGIRSNQVILSHINLLLFARLIKLFSPGTKIIVFAHGIELWREIPKWKKIFLQQSVEIWAVSAFTASKLVEIHQLKADSIKILNNCLDPYFVLPKTFKKPTHLLQRYNLTIDQPVLFTLTRLSSQETYKGYDNVLMSIPTLLNKFPNLHYILAGKADHIEKERVQNLIDKLNLKMHVTLAGFIKDEELTNYFCLGDVFIMPSTQEGFGIVFIEAAACGTPCIGGNIDGSADALLNGKLGSLIDPNKVEEITMAIKDNLSHKKDPLALQELCISHFSHAKYADKLKKLILC
ncbi:glycosyltransferase family 4 protein [Pedobacter sp. Du54]|uniref:glycosyltransferase family 4 protein n=1 Tax=Pedobacter anseongensis TaxID=3133439 RepID=UPI0030B3EF4D